MVGDWLLVGEQERGGTGCNLLSRHDNHQQQQQQQEVLR